MSQPVTVDAAAPLSCTHNPSHPWLTAVHRLALSHALPSPPQPPPRRRHYVRISLDGWLWPLSVCIVDLSDCATVPVRPVLPSQTARCFVLADVREHATCIMGASGNSDDITILSWTLSRYRDPKKVHDLSARPLWNLPSNNFVNLLTDDY